MAALLHFKKRLRRCSLFVSLMCIFAEIHAAATQPESDASRGYTMLMRRNVYSDQASIEADTAPVGLPVTFHFAGSVVLDSMAEQVNHEHLSRKSGEMQTIGMAADGSLFANPADQVQRAVVDTTAAKINAEKLVLNLAAAKRQQILPAVGGASSVPVVSSSPIVTGKASTLVVKEPAANDPSVSQTGKTTEAPTAHNAPKPEAAAPPGGTPPLQPDSTAPTPQTEPANATATAEGLATKPAGAHADTTADTTAAKINAAKPAPNPAAAQRQQIPPAAGGAPGVPAASPSPTATGKASTLVVKEPAANDPSVSQTGKTIEAPTAHNVPKPEVAAPPGGTPPPQPDSTAPTPQTESASDIAKALATELANATAMAEGLATKLAGAHVDTTGAPHTVTMTTSTAARAAGAGSNSAMNVTTKTEATNTANATPAGVASAPPTGTGSASPSNLTQHVKEAQESIANAVKPLQAAIANYSAPQASPTDFPKGTLTAEPSAGAGSTSAINVTSKAVATTTPAGVASAPPTGTGSASPINLTEHVNEAQQSIANVFNKLHAVIAKHSAPQVSQTTGAGSASPIIVTKHEEAEVAAAANTTGAAPAASPAGTMASTNATALPKSDSAFPLCSTTVCPSGYVQKALAGSTSCLSALCNTTAEDRDICCDQASLCTNNACRTACLLPGALLTIANINVSLPCEVRENHFSGGGDILGGFNCTGRCKLGYAASPESVRCKAGSFEPSTFVCLPLKAPEEIPTG